LYLIVNILLFVGFQKKNRNYLHSSLFLKAKDKENLSKSVNDKQLSTWTSESFSLNVNYKLWDKIVNYKQWDEIIKSKSEIKLDGCRVLKYPTRIELSIHRKVDS